MHHRRARDLERGRRPAELRRRRPLLSHTALISAQGLVSRYGGEEVLRGFSFRLDAPEAVALVGVNGAGKSTFLRLLLGLHPRVDGAAALAGVAVDEAPARAPLAYLPERFLPPYALTGRAFLDLARRLYGARSAGRDRVAEAGASASAGAGAEAAGATEAEVLAALDFNPERLALRVGALSKGTAQKLGLAAVVLSGRPLWVLDEPFSGLDPLAREGLIGLLVQHRANGGSILYTTHALADVPRVADRMVVLHGGVARFDGTPAALMSATAEHTLEAAWMACVAGRAHGVAPA